MNIVRSTASLFSAKILGFAVVFLGIVYFSRTIDPTVLGVFFLFQAICKVVGVVIDLGITGAAKKRISEGFDLDEVFTTAILLKLVPVALTALLIAAFADLIDGYLGASLAMWLIVAIFCQQYAMFAVDVIEGELRVGRTAYLHFARAVSWIGTSIALVHLGYGVHGIVYGLIVGYAVMLVLGLLMTEATVVRPTGEALRSLIDFAKYNFISNLNWEMHSWIDVLMLGVFATQADVAAYEMAWRVTEVLILFSATLGTVIFPQISAWEAEGHLDRVESLVERSITPSLLPVLPALFGSLVVSRDLLGIVFGPEYRIAGLALVVLMVQKVLQSVYVIFSRSLSAIDQPALDARGKIASIAVNVVLNVLLVSAFGLIGAAVATTLAFAVNLGLTTRYLSRFIGIRLPYAQIKWCALASTVMLVPVALFARNAPMDTVFELVAVCGLGALVYLGLLAFSPLREELVDQFRSLTA